MFQITSKFLIACTIREVRLTDGRVAWKRPSPSLSTCKLSKHPLWNVLPQPHADVMKPHEVLTTAYLFYDKPCVRRQPPDIIVVLPTFGYKDQVVEITIAILQACYTVRHLVLLRGLYITMAAGHSVEQRTAIEHNISREKTVTHSLDFVIINLEAAAQVKLPPSLRSMATYC